MKKFEVGIIFNRVLIVLLAMFCIFIFLENKHQAEQIKDMTVRSETISNVLIETQKDIIFNSNISEQEFDIIINLIDELGYSIEDTNNSITSIEIFSDDLQQQFNSVSAQRLFISEDEWTLLGYLGMSEAGVCSVETIQKVVSVVLNRMYDSRYDSTLEEIVFDRNGGVQFSVTLNDGEALYRHEPNSGVLKAMELAMYNDNSEGALGFLNIQLAIDQGYEHNVISIMKNNYELSTSSGVTFIKPKGE